MDHDEVACVDNRYQKQNTQKNLTTHKVMTHFETRTWSHKIVFRKDRQAHDKAKNTFQNCKTDRF